MIVKTLNKLNRFLLFAFAGRVGIDLGKHEGMKLVESLLNARIESDIVIAVVDAAQNKSVDS